MTKFNCSNRILEISVLNEKKVSYSKMISYFLKGKRILTQNNAKFIVINIDNKTCFDKKGSKTLTSFLSKSNNIPIIINYH